jgi:hypothetical protein
MKEMACFTFRFGITGKIISFQGAFTYVKYMSVYTYARVSVRAHIILHLLINK